MGGNVNGRGNITPTAEFNFYSDPEAAHCVLSTMGRIVTLLPQDLFEQHSFPWKSSDWDAASRNSEETSTADSGHGPSEEGGDPAPTPRAHPEPHLPGPESWLSSRQASSSSRKHVQPINLQFYPASRKPLHFEKCNGNTKCNENKQNCDEKCANYGFKADGKCSTQACDVKTKGGYKKRASLRENQTAKQNSLRHCISFTNDSVSAINIIPGDFNCDPQKSQTTVQKRLSGGILKHPVKYRVGKSRHSAELGMGSEVSWAEEGGKERLSEDGWQGSHAGRNFYVGEIEGENDGGSSTSGSFVIDRNDVMNGLTV
jgi:hypothetical protein